MDQPSNSAEPALAPNTRIKKSLFLLIIFICLVVSIPVYSVGYHFGYTKGNQRRIMTNTSVIKAKKIAIKPKVVVPTSEPTPQQAISYALFYTAPAGWRSIVWHPDPNSAGSAILSPDYTSIADPEPQTGLTILIYQFPQQYNDMKQMRPDIEETEDNMKGLTQTTVAGFSTWHATFVSTDSDRVVDDYNILKDHDRWIVRIVTPGNSLPAAKAEEQKYYYQINGLLQSIQFKTIQSN